MDERTKIAIHQFVELVVSVQEPGYPSCEIEIDVLIEETIRNLKQDGITITKIQARAGVLDELRNIEMGRILD